VITFLKTALEKVVVGLMYGVGIGAAMAATWYFLSKDSTDRMWNDAAVDMLTVTQHQEVTRDGALFVLGTVESRAADRVRSISIQVDLFDKEGRFVDQCAEHLRGSLKPGESRNFKVPCGGAKERPVVPHDSYKIKVVGL
jgi:hypothetical protein